MLIFKEGYPPEWDEEVFKKVLIQVENYKKNGSSIKPFKHEDSQVADENEPREIPLYYSKVAEELLPPDPD